MKYNTRRLETVATPHFSSLRTEDVFPVVREREATTGNASAIRRLENDCKLWAQ